jgi:hypothetical protein
MHVLHCAGISCEEYFMTPAVMFELAITQHITAVQEQRCCGRPLRVAQLHGESGVLTGGIGGLVPTRISSRKSRPCKYQPVIGVLCNQNPHWLHHIATSCSVLTDGLLSSDTKPHDTQHKTTHLTLPPSMPTEMILMFCSKFLHLRCDIFTLRCCIRNMFNKLGSMQSVRTQPHTSFSAMHTRASQ